QTADPYCGCRSRSDNPTRRNGDVVFRGAGFASRQTELPLQVNRTSGSRVSKINRNPGGVMAAMKLKNYLNSRRVKYVTIEHSPAYTAPETAASAHVSGRDFAKTVIVESGDGLAMVVLPANRKIVLSDLREMLGDPNLKLATED